MPIQRPCDAKAPWDADVIRRDLWDDPAVGFLAGGESQRMGRPKALLTLGGESFLQRQARLFSCAGERLLSSNDPRVALPGVPAIADDRPGLGPLAGLCALLERCKSARLAVIPCDLPLMDPAVVQRLLEAMGDDDFCGAAVGGRRQPLGAVYSRRALPSLRREFGRGGRRLTAALDGLRVRWVPMDDEAAQRAFFNVNTPEDLKRLEEEWM